MSENPATDLVTFLNGSNGGPLNAEQVANIVSILNQGQIIDKKCSIDGQYQWFVSDYYGDYCVL